MHSQFPVSCSPNKSPKSRDTAKRILILDDNPLMRDTLTKQLNFLGYNCYACASAIQAVVFFLYQSVDLVLTDYEMPDMNGLEFLDYLSAIGLKGVTPVVMVSGNMASHLPLTAKTHGAASFMAKPVNLSELDRVLAQVLQETQRTDKAHNTPLPMKT